MKPAIPPKKSPRIEGFDLARSLAIFGMIVVHFMLVMSDGTPAELWSDRLLKVLDGRPAATFVILAGIGVAMMAKKASGQGTREQISANKVFRRRGLLLLACGFLNLMIWEGDILRVYGVCMLLVPWLVWRNAKVLLTAGIAFVLGFCVMLALFDYDKNWDWNTMTYHQLWTSSGLFRSLFFDGFRSVFPWAGLLVFGIWLGRLDWSGRGIARKAMAWGLGLLATTTAVSLGTRTWLAGHPQPGLDRASADALLGLQSMPPLPLFLLNATGGALLVIGVSMSVARRFGGSLAVNALVATGRMAFTWYVAHIVLGLGGVIMIGWTRTTHLKALVVAASFFFGAASVSLWWSKRFARGPMESLLRRVGGS